jgi:hypothetical protein
MATFTMFATQTAMLLPTAQGGDAMIPVPGLSRHGRAAVADTDKPDTVTGHGPSVISRFGPQHRRRS